MRHRLIVPAVALAAVAAAWMLLRGDDEQRILERLEQARALAEVDGRESPLAQLERARQLGTLFTPLSRYDLTTLGHGITDIGSHEELVRRIVAARSQLNALEISLLAPVVRIDGEHATVGVTGTALGATRHGDGQFMDVHRVEIDLQKENGAWRITGGRHIRDERASFSDGR